MIMVNSAPILVKFATKYNSLQCNIIINPAIRLVLQYEGIYGSYVP